MIIGQTAQAAGTASGRQQLLRPLQIILHPRNRGAGVAKAIVMPDQRLRFPFRIFVHGHLVTGVDVSRAVRDINHVPVLGLDRCQWVQAHHKRTDQAGTGVCQVHVVIGNTIRVAGSPNARLARAALVIPASAAPFQVDNRITGVRHAVHKELVLRAVTTDSAGFGCQGNGLPGVIVARRKTIVEPRRVGK